MDVNVVRTLKGRFYPARVLEMTGLPVLSFESLNWTGRLTGPEEEEGIRSNRCSQSEERPR